MEVLDVYPKQGTVVLLLVILSCGSQPSQSPSALPAPSADAPSADAPGADDPASGVHALAYYEYYANGNTSITTPPMTTQSSGSTILLGVGRGDHSAHTTPSDNKGNTYVQLGTSHTYTNWGDSGTALYASQGTSSGGSAHQVTVATAAYDETTVAAVEIKNGGSIEDHKWNEDLANPAMSLGVTTSGPAVLVAFWFGDGGIGSGHTATPNNGFSIVESLTLDGGLVQLTVATRAVPAAGTYDVEWNAPSGEGAQLYLVAVRKAEGTGMPAPSVVSPNGGES